MHAGAYLCMFMHYVHRYMYTGYWSYAPIRIYMYTWAHCIRLLAVLTYVFMYARINVNIHTGYRSCALSWYSQYDHIHVHRRRHTRTTSYSCIDLYSHRLEKLCALPTFTPRSWTSACTCIYVYTLHIPIFICSRKHFNIHNRHQKFFAIPILAPQSHTYVCTYPYTHVIIFMYAFISTRIRVSIHTDCKSSAPCRYTHHDRVRVHAYMYIRL